ncbi:MAG TPA: IPT/TIG domain-containing protein [Solirubrobacteraceae bacterium]|nr:IPT/TIG domain-containing protein [Solirubrobacteraceae bacterium]
MHAASLVGFRGHVSGGSGAVVLVQRRTGPRWRLFVRGHADGRGRFVLTSAAPVKAGRLVVRAVVLGGRGVAAVSVAKTVRVLALGKGVRPVVASSRTEVLDSSVISSAPAPGQPGTLRYAGGNDAHVGQIIAASIGRATPDGLLVRATKVSYRHGRTIVNTQPATLLEAVPSGSLKATFQSASAARARTASLGFPPAPVTCSNGVHASITPNLSFSAGISLASDWSLFGGLQSASLTAHASASASLKATISGSASCTLRDTELATIPGPGTVVFVGFVPVVLTSDISVSVDGDASVSASTTTGASASFSAEAGIGWDHNRGFYPIHNFSSHFAFTAPTISASASVAANLTPTLHVLVYGIAGPAIALKTGLAFDAKTTDNPWWKLTAPIDLTAGLAIPALNLKSPTLDVYKHTYPIVDAGGPFGSTGGTVTVTNPGNLIGTVGTPVNVQMHASDIDGGTLRYSATGLPPGLSINASSGLISGAPTSVANSTVTVVATDATGPSGQTSFGWTINAASFTWTGAAPVGQSRWSNVANWAGGLAPSGTVGTLTFPQLETPECEAQPATATCNQTYNDLIGLNVEGMSLGCHFYEVSGNAIALGGGGLQVCGGSSLALPITLASPQTWSVHGSLLLRADVMGPSSALAVNLGSESTLQIEGVDVEAGPVTITGPEPQFSPGLSLGGGSINGTDRNPVTLTEAYIEGSGTIGPLTTKTANLAPQGTGTLAVSGGVTLDPSTSVNLELGGTPRANITATADVNLENALLNISGTCPLPAGAKYTLITTPGSLNGTFSGVADGTILAVSCFFAPEQWVRINYTSHAVEATVIPPVVEGISPNEGPEAGGTSVTITGRYFATDSTVKFGATTATSVKVNAATSITAVAPPGTGTTDVTVTTAGGTSTTSAADLFTYVPPPTVTELSLKEGPEGGGTSVTITGTNFTSASAVKFGTTTASSVKVNSGTSITATSPAGTGTKDVTVAAVGGTSATSVADQFTYVPPPTVTELSPKEGPEGGGTSVTITGTNFTSASAVKFGTTPASSVKVNSGTSITAVSPAGTGTKDVTVTTVGGTSATSAADRFTYG